MEVIMPEEVKFTEEELTQVQNIQKSYANVQNQFGQLKLAQIRLDKDEIQLEDALKSIQEEENKFLEGITEKYGQGSLNPEPFPKEYLYTLVLRHSVIRSACNKYHVFHILMKKQKTVYLTHINQVF